MENEKEKMLLVQFLLLWANNEKKELIFKYSLSILVSFVSLAGVEE